MLKQLVERRKAKGLSRADVARGSGIGLSHYTKIENQVRVPSLPVAKRIAECLGVPIEAVFCDLLGDDAPLQGKAADIEQAATRSA